MVQVVPPSKPFAISAANHEAATTDQASHSSLRGEGNEFLSRSLSAVGLPVGRVADADTGSFWGEGGGRGGVPDTVPRMKQASLQKALASPAAAKEPGSKIQSEFCACREELGLP